MDFDMYLTKVQGSFKSIEKSLGTKLRDITTGCDEQVQTILTAFNLTLQNLDPCSDDGLRRINLFLILNTEFNSSKLASNDVNYCHLVGIIPQLSSYLYFELMAGTKLYKYIGEVILFSPDVLAVEVMKTVISYLSLVKSNIGIEFLNLIYGSLFQKIIQLEEDPKTDNVKEMFIKAFQRFLDFSVSDFNGCSNQGKIESQCYFGRYVKMMLNVLEFSINRFKATSLDEVIDLYKIKIDYDYSQWQLQTTDSKNWPLYALGIIVSKCKEVIREVSVDIYCAWCEEEFKEGDEKSLQMEVREAAYTCQEALKGISEFEESIMDLSPLIISLSHFALKPHSEDDEIVGADINLIISNMRNPNKTQLKWLKAFLKIENVLSNESCLSILDDMVLIFDFSACQEFLSVVLKCVKSGTYTYTYLVSLKNILFKAIKLLKVKEQLQLLEDYYKHETENHLKTPNFNLSMTESFNKMANEDNIKKFFPDIIILTLQSASEVLPHIIDECLKNPVRCDLFIPVLCDIKIFKQLQIGDGKSLVLTLVVNKFEETIRNRSEENNNLMHMIQQYSYHKIIDGKEFLTKHVIPAIQTTLNDKKWQELDLCLDVLSVFVNGRSGDYVSENMEALIVFLVRLLDKCRLQPPAFNVHSASACEKTCDILSVLVSLLMGQKNGVSDKNIKWLQEVSSQCHPLSWFHLRKLWGSSPLPDDPKGFLTWSLQDMGQEDLVSMPPQKRASFVTKLCKVLPLLTSKEWKMIGYNLGGAACAEKAFAVYHILADCFLIFVQLPVINDSPVCLAHLFSNFIGFVKFKVIGALKHGNRDTNLTAFKKLVLLTTELPEGIVKSRVAALVSVFQEMVDSIISKTENGQTQSDLIISMSPITEPTLQSALSQKIIVRLSERVS